jgi:hypothetical protein
LRGSASGMHGNRTASPGTLFSGDGGPTSFDLRDARKGL